MYCSNFFFIYVTIIIQYFSSAAIDTFINLLHENDIQDS